METTIRSDSTCAASAVELTVVVPTYNERANIALLLAALESALAGMEWEAIFVDDNSPDGTSDYIRRIAAANRRVRLLERTGHRGLASACIEGMRAARAPYIAVMDADLQHDERILPQMLNRLKSDMLDVVVGSRTISGGSMKALPSGRVLLSRVGAQAARRICHLAVSDAMSGFFVVRRSFFEKTAPHLQGIGFKVLLDLLTSAETVPRFDEVPYVFRKRQQGTSKFELPICLAYLRFLWRRAAQSSYTARTQ